MTTNFTLRPVQASDAAFLTEMLMVAADWRPGAEPRSREEIMAAPSFAHYIEGWPREGDFGIVAEDSTSLGAAWWRYFRADDPGYGFVDDATPEITIGVREPAPGRGIGRAMLDMFVAEANRRELQALSLSVEPDNYAMQMYEAVGFRPVGDSAGAVTMVMIIGGRV
ncbi:MAG: GNAT family N-acetyltransferase [Acidimicrobiales bacterium]